VFSVAAVIVLCCFGLFCCQRRRKRKMRHSSYNKKRKDDEIVETPTRILADDANRSVDTTLGDEDQSVAGARNAPQRGLSLDCTEDASADGAQVTQPLPRTPGGLPTNEGEADDGPASSRRGRKPQRTVSMGAPRALPVRNASSDNSASVPPRRAPPTRSVSSDGMPSRGHAQINPADRQGPPVGNGQRTASKEVAATRGPPTRSYSSDDYAPPTRLPTGAAPQSRLPTTARAPPQRTRSEQVPHGHQGIHRMPSVRAANSKNANDGSNGYPQQTRLPR